MWHQSQGKCPKDGEVKKYLQQRKRIKETIRPSPPCDKKIKETTKTKDAEKRDL